MSNRNLKININYQLKNTAYGGGNSFIRNLVSYLNKVDIYEIDPMKSDIIIFNGHHDLLHTLKLKKKFPKTIFIHRLDGPMNKLRKTGKFLDYLIKIFTIHCADAQIFQSKWSLQENIRLKYKIKHNHTIIGNACNAEIFKKIKPAKKNNNKKIKLLAASWSNNLLKGVETLKFLDQNLDMEKYEIKFIGNTDEIYDNIKCYRPMDQKKLANAIHESDIFIFGSHFESYSNMLIEAVSCGIPVLTRDVSSNREIVLDDRLLFKTNYDLLKKIDLVAKTLNTDIKFNYKVLNISEVGEKYIIFCKDVVKKVKPKKISILKYFYLHIIYYTLQTYIFIDDRLKNYK